MVSCLNALTRPPQTSTQPGMGMGELELRLGSLQGGDGLAECVQSLLAALGHCSASQRDTQCDRDFIALREANLLLDKHIRTWLVAAEVGDDAGKRSPRKRRRVGVAEHLQRLLGCHEILARRLDVTQSQM